MQELRQWLELVESTSDDDLAELAQLHQQLAVLMTRWEENKKIKPQANDTGQGYSTHTADSLAWYNDPQLGRLWELSIYPLNQRIEQIEAKIKKQKRIAILHTKAGSDAGFDTSEVLYHGTNVEFDTFDRSKTRTAAHLYTSPDIATARGYGDIIYAVYGRQQPQADLTIESDDYPLMRTVYRRGLFKKNWNLSLADFTELVHEAQLYKTNSSMQDDVVSTCLALKYKSVRITDGVPGGSFSDSVIFGEASDLQIIEREE